MNDPAAVGAGLAQRSLVDQRAHPGREAIRRGRTSRCCGPSAMTRRDRFSTPQSQAPGQAATAVNSPSTSEDEVGSHSAAAKYAPPRGTRARRLPRLSCRRAAHVRVLNASLLLDSLVELGELDDAAQVLEQFDGDIYSGSLTAAMLQVARGRLRVAQGRVADGLDDFLEVGTRLSLADVSCPSFLAWRSEAALAHLTLGDRESAARLAEEELELARCFGTPRAIGVAARAAGIIAGGDRGEALLRVAVDELERGDAKLEHARALADLGAMLRRRNRRTEARELLRTSLDAAHRAGAKRLAEFAEVELRATGAARAASLSAESSR